MQELKRSLKLYAELNVYTLELFVNSAVAAPRGFGGSLGTFHLWD